VLLNEEFFFSGSNDGTVALWNINKKKPVTFVKNAHGSGHNSITEQYQPTGWITAVAAFQNSDLLASGIYYEFILNSSLVDFCKNFETNKRVR
jgi:ribosomal RNA-processing protein 9